MRGRERSRSGCCKGNKGRGGGAEVRGGKRRGRLDGAEGVMNSKRRPERECIGERTMRRIVNRLKRGGLRVTLEEVERRAEGGNGADAIGSLTLPATYEINKITQRHQIFFLLFSICILQARRNNQSDILRLHLSSLIIRDSRL